MKTERERESADDFFNCLYWLSQVFNDINDN